MKYFAVLDIVYCLESGGSKVDGENSGRHSPTESQNSDASALTDNMPLSKFAGGKVDGDNSGRLSPTVSQCSDNMPLSNFVSPKSHRRNKSETNLGGKFFC